MRNIKNLIAVLFCTLLTTGCVSSLWSRDAVVTLETGLLVNPDKNFNPQPVKLCVIEARREGWSLPGVYNGSVCSEVQVSEDVVSVERYILPPGKREVYQKRIEDNAPRWFIVGAEFQKGVGADSLIEKYVASGKSLKIKVVADNTSLTVLKK